MSPLPHPSSAISNFLCMTCNSHLVIFEFLFPLGLVMQRGEAPSGEAKSDLAASVLFLLPESKKKNGIMWEVSQGISSIYELDSP